MNARTKVHAWLRLLRLPNLLTVPGDPIAGFILASSGGEVFSRRVAWACLASGSFYAAGLLFNDLADVETDREERPDRPLPSGAVAARSAAVAGALLLLCGLACAFAAGRSAGAVGLLLAVAVLAYDFWSKKLALIGSLNLGLCRGLSLLLGAAAATSSAMLPVLAGAGFQLLYVSSVGRLARNEAPTSSPSGTWSHLARCDHGGEGERGGGIGPLQWAPALAAVTGFILILAVGLPGGIPAWLGFVAFWWTGVGVAVLARTRLNRQPDRIPSTIGLLIGGLILFQASFCMAFGALTVGACVVLLWPAFLVLSRWFYAS